MVSDDEHDDTTEKPKKIDRNRDSLVYDDEDDQPNAKWDRNLQRDLVAAATTAANTTTASAKLKQNTIARDGKARTQPNDKFKVFLTDDEGSSSQETKKRSADEMRKKNDTVSNTPKALISSASCKTPQPTAGTSRQYASPMRPVLTDNNLDKLKLYKPFNKLLEGVVLVISGIQVRNSDKS